MILSCWTTRWAMWRYWWQKALGDYFNCFRNFAPYRWV